ncbi:MAG: DUF4831 family protein [Bacteroidales bacterium]|nr:DUF4831 family protein [Bacteroidales bacterium]
MKRKILSATAALVLLLQASMSQYAVYPASARLAKPAENALFYSLPQNSYRLTVEIEETIQERGVYSDYAEKMLKLPAIKENTVSYKIKHVGIKTLAYPDPKQVYGVQGNDLPALRLSPDGILLGVNMVEHHMSGGDRPCQGGDKDRHHKPHAPAEEPQADESKPVTALKVADLNIRQKFDTIVRRYQTDTNTVIEKVLRPVVDEKSLAEQARKMADLIFKIQAAKADLISGLQEVAYPAGTMEFMYKQMERNERNYLECFTGTVRKQTVSYSFDITPEEGVLEYPVAVFSSELGIEPADAEELLENHLVFRLSLLPFVGAEAAGFQKANTIKDKPGGFYYRMPRKATASIVYGGKEIESRDVFVAQWGKVFQLPVRNHYRLRLDGKNGGLMYFGPTQEKGTK